MGTKKEKGTKSGAGRKKKTPSSNIDLNITSLSHLPKEEEEETLDIIQDYISRSVEKGIIPIGMVPLVEDLLNVTLAEIHASPPVKQSILPESLNDFEATVGISRASLLIPPMSEPALYSIATYGYLLGGPGDILFQMDGDEGSSFTDFLKSEWLVPVLEEVLFELVLLVMHLMPGGHGAAGVAEKVAKQAAKNRTIRRLVVKFLDDLMTYGARGKGLAKLRKNLQALFIALTEMDLFSSALKEFFKALSAWAIFLIILDVLLAFTPAGWGKRVAVILLSVGAITHALHTKYELFKKEQA